MPTKRLSMRRIHRLMTLRFGAGATTRAISRELGISHSTVREYLARIAAAGITWPLPAELGDLELEQRLFVNGGVRGGARHHVEPDWAAVARELKCGFRGKAAVDSDAFQPLIPTQPSHRFRLNPATR